VGLGGSLNSSFEEVMPFVKRSGCVTQGPRPRPWPPQRPRRRIKPWQARGIRARGIRARGFRDRGNKERLLLKSA
jgi:hypothetical protein